MRSRNSPFYSLGPTNWNRRRLENICGWSHRMPGRLRSSTRSWLCWHSTTKRERTVRPSWNLWHDYWKLLITNLQLRNYRKFRRTGYPLVLNAAHFSRLSFILVGELANDGLLTAAVDEALCWSIILNLSFALTAGMVYGLAKDRELKDWQELKRALLVWNTFLRVGRLFGHLVVHGQVPLLLIDRLLHSVLDRQFPLVLDSIEVGISLLCKFEIGKQNFSHFVCGPLPKSKGDSAIEFSRSILEGNWNSKNVELGD